MIYPRVNGPIFDTGKNFTPENFPEAWDRTMEKLEEGGLGSSSGGFDLALWGCGRVAGSDYFGADATKITLPSSPSLALKLPSAVYYVADSEGAIHRFSATVRTVTGVPALLDSKRGYLRAVEVEDGDGEFTLELFGWSDALDAVKVASGYPCVGIVSSSANAVTSVAPTDATVILPQPLIQSVLRNLLAASGGSGSGEGGSGYNSLEQLPVAVGDVTTSKAYIDGRFNDIEATLAQQGEATNMFPAPFDVLADEIALNRAGLAEVNPPSIERGQISVVTINAGKGQNDTPDFAPNSPTTNDPLELPWDAQEGVFGP